jgi:signal transduction histidine kinase
MGLSLILLLVISLLVFLYIIFRKNKKISEQKINDIRQKEELSLTKAILEGEERERERIARDLHDGLGGMLAGVKLIFQRGLPAIWMLQKIRSSTKFWGSLIIL